MQVTNPHDSNKKPLLEIVNEDSDLLTFQHKAGSYKTSTQKRFEEENKYTNQEELIIKQNPTIMSGGFVMGQRGNTGHNKNTYPSEWSSQAGMPPSSSNKEYEQSGGYISSKDRERILSNIDSIYDENESKNSLNRSIRSSRSSEGHYDYKDM